MSAFQTNTVILSAVLPSGSRAVYEIEERQLNTRGYHGQSQNGRLIEYGRLLAVKNGGDWYNRRGNRSSWSERITDPKAVALLESYPSASLEQ